MKGHIIGISIIVLLVIGFVVFMTWSYNYGNSSTTSEYSLSELDEGVYGIYTVVSSSIPAQNYDMVTLCVDGTVRTFKGFVNIIYTNEEPKLVLTDKNYINSDIMYIYVPNGTIEFSANVGIGSRR